MEPIWRPEVEVGVAFARRLIARAAPALGQLEIERLGQGFDNVAYLVGRQWVFRFPQRRMGGDLMVVENRVLPMLAGRLPVAVPIPEHLGEPTEDYPFHYAGYRAIDGETGDRCGLDEDARTSLAEPLGRFLAALHAIPGVEARAADPPGDLIGRMDLTRRVTEVHQRLDEAQRRGWLDTADFAPIPEAVDPSMNVRGDVLCHGDLYDRHLIIDPETRTLAGVIDWGDVHLGDPGVDIAVAHRVLPVRAHSAFRAAYGDIAEWRWDAARNKALHHALSTLFYARDVGDASLEAGSLTSLAMLREVSIS